MKKNLSFTIFALIVFAFSSCKEKSYTCTCEGGLTGKGIIVTINSKSKKSADTECAKNNGNPAVDGYINCHIQ